jgi:hypothetical protein
MQPCTHLPESACAGERVIQGKSIYPARVRSGASTGNPARSRAREGTRDPPELCCETESGPSVDFTHQGKSLLFELPVAGAAARVAQCGGRSYKSGSLAPQPHPSLLCGKEGRDEPPPPPTHRAPTTSGGRLMAPSSLLPSVLLIVTPVLLASIPILCSFSNPFRCRHASRLFVFPRLIISTHRDS